MSGINDGRFLEWRGDQLYVDRRSSGYSIIQDERYPTMWRVRSPAGKLSDMVNRARAKDAALAMVDLGIRRQPKGARPVRFSSARVSGIGNEQKDAHAGVDLEI
jgi:hypothetical protein